MNCDCIVCRNNHNFTIDKVLLDEILNGKVVLFAGAGISTESKTVLKNTFYDQIVDEIGAAKGSFPELMEAYCKRPNGRLELLRNIQNRFNHINSYSELKIAATRFHHEIGSFFPLKDIVTTNWDTYFEEICNAVPFVNDPDLAFWGAADRRVLKIHGSIASLGSIVATTTDYKKCQISLNKGLIGSKLKSILATQTIIFTGYSFADSDFNSIYKFVQKQMKELHRQSYIITPFKEEAVKFASIGLIPIVTDGAFFWKNVKMHAIAANQMLDDGIYTAAYKLLKLVRLEHNRLHKKIKMTSYPSMIFAACYQDGLMQALDRILTRRGTGEYSNQHRVFHLLETYEAWKKEKLSAGIYEDVAYIEGYLTALIFIFRYPLKPTEVPMYFGFRSRTDLMSISQYLDYLQVEGHTHKASIARSNKLIAKYANPDSIVFHHPPWL